VQSTMQDSPLLISGIIRHGDPCTPKRRSSRHARGCRGGNVLSGLQARRAVGRRAHQARGANPATGLERSCGTTRRTWRPTSRSRAWARCCTPSTSGSSRNSWRFHHHAGDSVDHPSTVPCSALSEDRDQIPSVKHIIVHGPDESGLLVRRSTTSPSSRPNRPGSMADVGRTIGRDHVLHLRDDRQPQGRRVSHRSTWLHSMAPPHQFDRTQRARSLSLDRVRCFT